MTLPEGYVLKRSARKTLAVEVKRDGAVIVRAPLRAGEREIERFLMQQKAWIEAHAAKAKARALLHPEPDAEEEKRLRLLAHEVIPQKVAFYSAVMGLHPSGIRITSAKTRFGSCSAKNSLCFSWRLMQYPMEAVEYVVVHELAHIRHKNHGKAFHDTVAAVLPDHKARRAMLKE